eukprot:jgi/Picre1/35446/NNA_002908.t1
MEESQTPTTTTSSFDDVVLPAPAVRQFPLIGDDPGPRCGHTLTTILGPNGDPSSAKLVLFGGATALEWSGKGSPNGPPTPSPNASGIRLAGATNDVHIFDVRSGEWKKVVPQGDPPSARAAHAAAAVGNMVVIQGGIGPSGLSPEDLHVLDFTDFNKPKWHRVIVQGGGPTARYAHSLALVGNRFLVVSGGNDGKQTLGDSWALDTSEKPYQQRCKWKSLADAFGLARHRDGRWEWAAAPGSMPSPRYQHGSVFINGRLHVMGGAIGGGRMVEKAPAVVTLDTSPGMWVGQADPGAEGDLMRRCRHAVASIGPYIFIHGGLKGSTLLEDFLLAEDATGAGELSVCDPRAPPWQEWIAAAHGAAAAQHLASAAAEEAEAAAALNIKRVDNSGDLKQMDASMPGARGSEPPGSVSLAQRRGEFPAGRDMPTPDIRLYHRAVVVAQEPDGQLRGLVRQLSIEQFKNEGRRVSLLDSGNDTPGEQKVSPVLDRAYSEVGVQKSFLQLLNPREWRESEDTRDFPYTYEQIALLCDAAEILFKSEETVLTLQAPVKIFGDLHGQFGDLMRLFDEYGTPSTAGDITYIDYLFLGDYVDRGAHSLETICLLLALKVEHPDHVHLIRGNHEAADINALFGFRLECLERLGEINGIKAWQQTADNGRRWHGLMDLLWSDPTVNDAVEGVQPSPRGPGLVTYGPDRVMEFCENNGLQMIVRAHECVMDGFERFAQGHLITLFSATNYCGTANNAGAILVLGRDNVMVPKLIHPLPPSTPRGSPINSDLKLEEEPPTPYAGASDTWMASVNEERPPTPPRGRPGGPSVSSSATTYFQLIY